MTIKHFVLYHFWKHIAPRMEHAHWNVQLLSIDLSTVVASLFSECGEQAGAAAAALGGGGAGAVPGGGG